MFWNQLWLYDWKSQYGDSKNQEYAINDYGKLHIWALSQQD